MTWMVEHNVGKIAQYAVRVWGVPESEDKKAVALEGIGKLKNFFTSLGLPVTFKELGVEILILTVWRIVCIAIKESWLGIM